MKRLATLIYIFAIIFNLSQPGPFFDENGAIFQKVTWDLGPKFLDAIRLGNPGNALISPSALAALYGLIYAASGGQQERELKNMLFYNVPSDAVVGMVQNYQNSVSMINSDNFIKFSSANKLVYQQPDASVGVLPFRGTPNGLISGEQVDKADFINRPDFARSVINDYILMRTFDKIPQLFGPDGINSESRVAVGSGATLDGTFTYGFNARDTTQRLFYPDQSTAVVVQAMSAKCPMYFYADTDQATAVGLPYGITERLIVYFIMPKNRYQLLALENSIMRNGHLTKIFGSSTDQNKVVTIVVPRVNFDVKPYDIRTASLQMGTTTMFAPGFANFGNINTNRELFVTNALHKTVFDLHEGSIKVCTDTGSALPAVEVNFNQPFLIAVIEKSTQNLLFYGRVTSL